jgi:hypothetical protein
MPECKACFRTYEEGTGDVLCTRHWCPPREAVAAWRRAHTGPFRAASTASMTTRLPAATSLKPIECASCWRTWDPADAAYPRCTSLSCPLRAAAYKFFAGTPREQKEKPKDDDYQQQNKKKKNYTTFDSLHDAQNAYRPFALQYLMGKMREIKAFKTEKRTMCMMLYVRAGGEINSHEAMSGTKWGNEKALRALREKNHIDPHKETVCAEEHLLLQHPRIQYLFSLAYDKDGVKAACEKGCKTLLKAEKIEDLWVYF